MCAEGRPNQQPVTNLGYRLLLQPEILSDPLMSLLAQRWTLMVPSQDAETLHPTC
ncbi:hypothetical protein BJ956_000539 [Arthrobacter psychrochitiniphilus]|nr:hypothetical protein [Arthrobacter psychrochitiniphilus]